MRSDESFPITRQGVQGEPPLYYSWKLIISVLHRRRVQPPRVGIDRGRLRDSVTCPDHTLPGTLSPSVNKPGREGRWTLWCVGVTEG